MKPHIINFDVREQVLRPDGTSFWRVATPEPYYLQWLWIKRYGCACGEVFKTKQDYLNHYSRAIMKAGVDSVKPNALEG